MTSDIRPATDNSGSGRRRLRLLREVALTLAAVCGLACLVAAIAAVFFGVTPLVLRSGSMEPTIPTGALAFAHHVDATEIEPGDVVSVENEQGIRITHRVVSVDATSANAVAMTLRGDANGVPDAQTYVVTSADRVAFHLDGLGYVVAWFDTVAGKMLCGIAVAALLWIAIFPTGRSRASNIRTDSRSATSTGLVVLVVCGLIVVAGAGQFRGTDAGYTDSASATTGSFGSRADIVPRLNQTISSGSYVSCENGGAIPRRTPILSWKHIGPPYQYRVFVRDTGDGTVYNTVDVTPATTVAAGTTLSVTLSASGFPAGLLTTSFDAEIHTMLPGGAVSPGWRGYRLYTDGTTGLRENMRCALVLPYEIDGTGPYVPPPTSMSCVTNTAAKTATLSWPHYSGYTYRVAVREPATGNVLYLATVNTPAATPAGQAISTTITSSNLGTYAGTTARAEVRSRNSNGVQSTGFVSYNLATASNSVACASTGPTAARVAPTSPSPTTSSPSTDPGTSISAPVSNTSSPPADGTPPSTITPTSGTPTEPSEQPLSPSEQAASRRYSAQIVESATGPVLLIRDASGNEELRMPTTAGATIRWAGDTDDLVVSDRAGQWLFTRGPATWTQRPYTTVEPETPTPEASSVPVAPSATTADASASEPEP